VLRKYVVFRRAKGNNPGLFFFLFISLWNILLKVRGQTLFPTKRFIKANRLPTADIHHKCVKPKSVEILFLAANKDLEMLPFSIPAAINSINENVAEMHVTVILPKNDISECQMLLSHLQNISLIDEESILSDEIRLSLKSRFGERYGWALQQFLKVVFVFNSELDGVFVVDADTILIDRRDWFCEGGHQILTPSDEFNLSYYEFLSSVGVGKLTPEFTFVSHHMLMQPWVLREAFAFVGWKNPMHLLESILSHTYLNEESPFSIDYEFYAQYMMFAYPELATLSKWSNFGVHRESELTAQVQLLSSKYSGKFSSISFHSYL
jgi:hypothetical protein